MPSTYSSNYLYYASENMAHPKLHEWACLMTLSVALSRKVWFQQGDWRIYPNMYVFFVGAPGDRKSTALKLAQKVIQDFTNIEIAPDQVTKEKLTQMMNKECGRQYVETGKLIDFSPITIFSSELVTLLGREPFEMVKFLTDIWDNSDNFKVGTKNMGTDYIVRPCVTMLGCLTPSTLTGMRQQDLITGGFCRRLILVYTSTKNKPIAFPVMTPAHYEAKNFCVEYAKKAQELVGPFDITQDARNAFKLWFEGELQSQEDAATEEVMKRWFSTKGDQVLKVAMCLSIADNLDKLIELKHFQKALALLDETEPDIMHVLGGAGRNELAAVARTVEALIKRYPDGITYKSLGVQMYSQCKEDDLTSILQHLIDAGSVVSEQKAFENGALVQLYYPPKKT